MLSCHAIGLHFVQSVLAWAVSQLCETGTEEHQGYIKNVLHCIEMWGLQLQALVHDTFPPATTIVDYAIGSFSKTLEWQQLYNRQMISEVSFITDHVAYVSTNKTQIV